MTRIPAPGGSPSDIPSFAHAVDGLMPGGAAEAAGDFAGGHFGDHAYPGGAVGGAATGTLPPSPAPDGGHVGTSVAPAAPGAEPSLPIGFPAPRPEPPPGQYDPALRVDDAGVAPVIPPRPLHMAGVLNPAALGGHPGYPADPGTPFGAPGGASSTAPIGGVDPFGSPGGPLVSYTLRVNGAMHVVDGAWLGESLLYVLRERLGLPGAKDGCGQGVCGTCTVLVDGAPAVSCMLPGATMGDREVTTVEGLADHGMPTAVRQALIAHGAVQCGFCVPGVVVSAHALLARIPNPDEATVRRALAGHPCRCAGPNRMVAAVCAVASGEPGATGASLFEPAGSESAAAGSAGTGSTGTGSTGVGSAGVASTGVGAAVAGPDRTEGASATATGSYAIAPQGSEFTTSTGIVRIPGFPPGAGSGPTAPPAR
ncbi:(2Fe-2S)-binding protein [Streptodolium elevatio]